MPIIASELKYFESTNNLGGSFVATEILDNTLHNLFDVVETIESEAGAINYRCIYVKNTNLTLTLALGLGLGYPFRLGTVIPYLTLTAVIRKPCGQLINTFVL